MDRSTFSSAVERNKSKHQKYQVEEDEDDENDDDGQEMLTGKFKKISHEFGITN